MNMNLKKENKRMIYSPEKLKMIVLNYLVVSEVLDNKHYVKCKMLVFFPFMQKNVLMLVISLVNLFLLDMVCMTVEKEPILLLWI
jgi:hypothetical protein